MSEDYWGRIDRLLASLQASVNRIDQKCDAFHDEIQSQTWMLKVITGVLIMLLIGLGFVILTIE